MNLDTDLVAIFLVKYLLAKTTGIHADLNRYAIPAVANMEITIGGILYTAIPFNGWYADTEIVRNMSDEGRYNKLPAIAESMGLDTSQETTMWRDEAMAVLDRAVMYSYISSGKPWFQSRRRDIYRIETARFFILF